MNSYNETNREVIDATERDLVRLGMNEDDLPRRPIRAWPVTSTVLSMGLHQAVLLNNFESRLFPAHNPMEAEPQVLVKRPMSERVERAFEDNFPRLGKLVCD